MKVKLVFTQTQYDQNNMWSAVRTVDVDLPEWVKNKFDAFEWHLTGMVVEGVE